MRARLIAGLTTALCLGAAAAPLTAVARSSVPHPGTSSELFGVGCSATTSCWAVGKYADASGSPLNQALHWNGHAWRFVTTPQPGGVDRGGYNSLLGVTCLTQRNCWAVGYYSSAMGGQLNQILHWNGQRWTLVHAPLPGQGSLLTSVSCASRTECWAVGHYTTMSNDRVEELHWNGTRWRRNRARGRLGDLTGVSCMSAANCWASGYYESSSALIEIAEHWNGMRWSTVTVPELGTSSELDAVTCRSASNCWMVGQYAQSGAFHSEILHLTNGSWAHRRAPTAGTGSGLLAITCRATTCWAAGAYTRSTGVTPYNDIVRHTTGRWRYFSSPSPSGGDTLFGISCPAPTSCWADGQVGTTGPLRNEILHFNGRHWRMS